ncbi:MAG: aminopeptidase P family protein [Proteobacteria bacterium]|nr:aminopeptidase P family protein [Pseudomonadota bacterium]
MATVEQALLGAQHKAENLFAAIVDQGLIRPGVLESELSREIHELAKRDFGLKRHWHKRVVRAGPNTVLSYYHEPPDRRVAADDVVYLDFGPLFDEWEADYGRTYVLGNDPLKHKLVADIETAFKRGKQRFMEDTELTAGGLYDYVSGLAREAGWEFAAPTAGHLVGHFPHETAPGDQPRFSIRSGNPISLREPNAKGERRHWILEIHFADAARTYGGFCEELLTI